MAIKLILQSAVRLEEMWQQRQGAEVMGQPSHLKMTRQSGSYGENDDIVPVLQCFMFVAQYIYGAVCFGFFLSYVTRFLRLLQNIAHI